MKKTQGVIRGYDETCMKHEQVSKSTVIGCIKFLCVNVCLGGRSGHIIFGGSLISFPVFANSVWPMSRAVLHQSWSLLRKLPASMESSRRVIGRPKQKSMQRWLCVFFLKQKTCLFFKKKRVFLNCMEQTFFQILHLHRTYGLWIFDRSCHLLCRAISPRQVMRGPWSTSVTNIICRLEVFSGPCLTEFVGWRTSNVGGVRINLMYHVKHSPIMMMEHANHENGNESGERFGR